MTFKLFTNCYTIKGANKSIVFDIQRGKYFNIPNSLYTILESNNLIDFEKLTIEYNNKKIIEEYKQFLIKNELIFECLEEDLVNFPKIENSFERPFLISNSIIEVSSLNKPYIPNLKETFDELGIEACVLIFYEEDLQFLEDILILFDDSRLNDIQILTPYNKDNLKHLKKIKRKYLRVSSINIHSSLKNKALANNINIICNKITNFNFCGFIMGNFTLNQISFFESLNHNTCLNRKISIDKDGNIKNCPSMSQSFGNIKDTTLEEALNHPDFKKYWNINKDQIEVCKDCEFRHICTDCRAYTERSHFDGEIDLSKPLKCGYNPYTNEWSEWSTNPLKQKAIEYYGIQELIKRKDT